jgi:hypothetical protein
MSSKRLDFLNIFFIKKKVLIEKKINQNKHLNNNNPSVNSRYASIATFPSKGKELYKPTSTTTPKLSSLSPCDP